MTSKIIISILGIVTLVVCAATVTWLARAPSLSDPAVKDFLNGWDVAKRQIGRLKTGVQLAITVLLFLAILAFFDKSYATKGCEAMLALGWIYLPVVAGVHFWNVSMMSLGFNRQVLRAAGLINGSVGFLALLVQWAATKLIFGDRLGTFDIDLLACMDALLLLAFYTVSYTVAYAAIPALVQTQEIPVSDHVVPVRRRVYHQVARFIWVTIFLAVYGFSPESAVLSSFGRVLLLGIYFLLCSFLALCPSIAGLSLSGRGSSRLVELHREPDRLKRLRIAVSYSTLVPVFAVVLLNVFRGVTSISPEVTDGLTVAFVIAASVVAVVASTMAQSVDLPDRLVLSLRANSFVNISACMIVFFGAAYHSVIQPVANAACLSGLLISTFAWIVTVRVAIRQEIPSVKENIPSDHFLFLYKSPSNFSLASATEWITRAGISVTKPEDWIGQLVAEGLLRKADVEGQSWLFVERPDLAYKARPPQSGNINNLSPAPS